jgi:predicted transcriptional regulator
MAALSRTQGRVDFGHVGAASRRPAVKQVVGLDASQNEAAIGVVDQNGKVLFADEAALVRRIRKRAPASVILRHGQTR